MAFQADAFQNNAFQIAAPGGGGSAGVDTRKKGLNYSKRKEIKDKKKGSRRRR